MGIAHIWGSAFILGGCLFATTASAQEAAPPWVVVDRDGDGIDDVTDACPDAPEDEDDADGCPGKEKVHRYAKVRTKSQADRPAMLAGVVTTMVGLFALGGGIGLVSSGCSARLGGASCDSAAGGGGALIVVGALCTGLGIPVTISAARGKALGGPKHSKDDGAAVAVIPRPEIRVGLGHAALSWAF